MEKQKRQKIQKILQLEQKKGFQNEAVLGGLQNFIENQTDSEQITDLIDGYAEMSPWKREQVIQELNNYLQNDTSGEKSSATQAALHSPVDQATGVGKKRQEQLNNLGLETIEDLLFHFPRKIDDRRNITAVGSLSPEETATVTGTVKKINTFQPRPNVKIVKAALQDESGMVFGVWFNQPWISNQISPGEEVAFYGTTERNYGELQIQNPVWEPLEERHKTRMLVPIYPATEDLSQTTLRWIIRKNLSQYVDQIVEYVPGEILERTQYQPRKEALPKIHNPTSLAEYDKARKSLSFSELFLFNYGLHYHSKQAASKSVTIPVREQFLNQFWNQLPFKPTRDQRNALSDIQQDLASSDPMNRLLQGDVGSGKTVVAAGACFLCYKEEVQSVLMAPTTVLAKQHYKTLQELFTPTDLTVELLTGDTSNSIRKSTLENLDAGKIDLIIGTHALLEEEVTFKKLGLAIIDEEQRFGVAQRKSLREKEDGVNRLVLSATPIPRTITATLYSQFDISRLEQLPHGNKQIETFWVAESRRSEVYESVATKLEKGCQAFIIFPLIEESDQLNLNAARQTKQELSNNQLKDFELGLVHGRLSDSEKQSVLSDFQQGNLDALVSTTVIEVGIDVPEVNLLVIEHADRFGLTQLHQLRGRIGRTGNESTCFAIASPSTDTGRQRLEAFREHLDGFTIVEKDLRIRGPGDLLGPAQHGFEDSFRCCNLLEDLEIMNQARAEVRSALPNLEADPSLIDEFDRRFGNAIRWIES